MKTTIKDSLTREEYPFLVGATYSRRDEARGAAETLQMRMHLNSDQISIVSPGDKHFGSKIETEADAIGRTLLHTHLNFGLLGAALGFGISMALTVWGPTAIQSSPSLSIIAFTIIGLFLGLLFAGLISIRPDHDPVIDSVREAVTHNHWAVVVRVPSETEKARAETLLNRTEAHPA